MMLAAMELTNEFSLYMNIQVPDSRALLSEAMIGNISTKKTEHAQR